MTEFVVEVLAGLVGLVVFIWLWRFALDVAAALNWPRSGVARVDDDSHVRALVGPGLFDWATVCADDWDDDVEVAR